MKNISLLQWRPLVAGTAMRIRGRAAACWTRPLESAIKCSIWLLAVPFCGMPAVAAAQSGDQSVTAHILYSSDAQGYFEPCG